MIKHDIQSPRVLWFYSKFVIELMQIHGLSNFSLLSLEMKASDNSKMTQIAVHKHVNYPVAPTAHSLAGR